MVDEDGNLAEAGDGTDASARISVTARALFAAGDVSARLERLVARAPAGADGCAMPAFVVEGERVAAPAASGPVDTDSLAR